MKIDRIISYILIVVIVVALAMVVYLIINPPTSEKFTEFYILGADGKAGNYPANLTSGEKVNITIGVVNHEHNTTSYLVRIKQDGNVLEEKNLTLKGDEKLEFSYDFTAGSPGQEKIEFNLFKLPDQQNVYRSLYLLINVI